MKECGLTQTALAEVLGVNLDRVKNITSGRAKKLTREESEALVKKLHIRAEWLVTGEGAMFQTVDAPQSHQVNQDVAPYGLRPDESALLAAYRSSSSEARAVVLRALGVAAPAKPAKPLERPSAREFGPSTERIPPREFGPDQTRRSQPREYGPDEAAESVDHKRGKKK